MFPNVPLHPDFAVSDAVEFQIPAHCFIFFHVVFAVGAQKRRRGYSAPQTLALRDSDVAQRLDVVSD